MSIRVSDLLSAPGLFAASVCAGGLFYAMSRRLSKIEAIYKDNPAQFLRKGEFDAEQRKIMGYVGSEIRNLLETMDANKRDTDLVEWNAYVYYMLWDSDFRAEDGAYRTRPLGVRATFGAVIDEDTKETGRMYIEQHVPNSDIYIDIFNKNVSDGYHKTKGYFLLSLICGDQAYDPVKNLAFEVWIQWADAGRLVCQQEGNQV